MKLSLKKIYILFLFHLKKKIDQIEKKEKNVRIFRLFIQKFNPDNKKDRQILDTNFNIVIFTIYYLTAVFNQEERIFQNIHDFERILDNFITKDITDIKCLDCL